jgi:hypothetical protein
MDVANAAYGKSVGTALKIVRQLHWDTGRLLTDFDGRMAEWRSIFGNTVTSSLSVSLAQGFWMAEGVYRYYISPTDPGAVRGVTVAFEENTKRRVVEPLFLATRIAYHVEPGREIETVCNAWDIWNLFFDKSERRELGHVINFHDPYPQRITRASLIAVPLYSIQSVEDAYRLLNEALEAA